VIPLIINESRNKIARYVIHYIALFLSISSVIYTLVQLSDNRIMQWFFVLFSLFVELFAQYLRGLASTFSRLKKRWTVAGLWLCYMVYIVVFAFLSAVGVFIAETNLSDQQYIKAAFTQEETKNEINRLNRHIVMLQGQQGREGETGTGPNYKFLQNKIDQDTAKRDVLIASMKNVPIIKNPSVYNGLHDIFNLPANWFKILMFGVAVIMIYLGLIITPWEIEVGEPGQATKRPTKKEDKTDEPRKVGTLTLAQKRQQLGGHNDG
jgi:hypothetical protein